MVITTVWIVLWWSVLERYCQRTLFPRAGTQSAARHLRPRSSGNTNIQICKYTYIEIHVYTPIYKYMTIQKLWKFYEGLAFSLTIIIDYYEHAAVMFVYISKNVTRVNPLQRQIQKKGLPRQIHRKSYRGKSIRNKVDGDFLTKSSPHLWDLVMIMRKIRWQWWFQPWQWCHWWSCHWWWWS